MKAGSEGDRSGERYIAKAEETHLAEATPKLFSCGTVVAPTCDHRRAHNTGSLMMVVCVDCQLWSSPVIRVDSDLMQRCTLWS